MKNKYVNRVDYLEFLKRSMNKHIIKVVSGVRRSGKSTLFKLFIDFLLSSGISNDQIFFINLEDPKFRHFINDPFALYNYVENQMKTDKQYYVFLDEIQVVQDFERAVNGLFLKENIDLYITGSNAYFLSGELATFLTGRYIELKMLPLSFKEFMNWHTQNDITITIDKAFEKYLKSSFPYSLFINSNEELWDYLQGIYSTVVLNDIVQRLNVQDARNLERLIETMFSSIGSLMNVNKIKNTLNSNGVGIKGQTIDRYIKGLTDSLIMYSAKRYDIHGRSLLSTHEKYYVVDIGLRQLLLRDHKEDFGYIMENIVFLELIRRGNKVYVGKTREYEVDFVAINARQEISYYQVSFNTLDPDVLTRELRPLEAIKDHYPKYLITMDNFIKTANYDGIMKVNLLDWLLE